MCTVSWWRRGGSYELFCNRDERQTRKPAGAPVMRERGGVRFVAPVDGDHGGAWIGVNQFGLALCLLNRYESPPPGGGRRSESRGLLLTGLLDGRSGAQLSGRVAEADLSLYRPFTLLVLTPSEPSLIFRWDGRERSRESPGEASMPLTSSSSRTAEVADARLNSFRRMARAARAVTPDLLRAFHHSHEPGRGPYSVCMHRSGAATVSFSRVRVRPEVIEFEYRPGAPCEGGEPVSLVLPRARA